MSPEVASTAAWFLAASSLVVLVFLVASSRRSPVAERLDGLGQGAGPGQAPTYGRQPPGRVGGPRTTTDNPVDRWTSRRMRQEEKKKDLKARMMQAGLYTPTAVGGFRILRAVLAIFPVAIGYLCGKMGIVPTTHGVLFGAMAGVAGTLAPSFWLDYVKQSRQTKIRRALPDALDVMVVCLEGGLSLTGAFARVARELATAHPMLAVEFQIVERQTQMGRTTGEAVREFANRFDLEELRSMASVIVQAERIGSSVVTALEVYAETLRQKRSQRAEEMAQKATIKLLFPTLFFIFPGIFIVILGPAAIQIYHTIIQGVLRNSF